MSLDSEIKSRELALGSLNPQQLTSRLQRGGIGLLDALATQKILSQKEAYKRDMAMQMENSPKTIAQKNEELLKQQSQKDVVDGVAGVLRNKLKKRNTNAKMLSAIDPRKIKELVKKPVPRGIPGAPVPQTIKVAQGGIIGFNEGMTVPDIDTTGDPAFLAPQNSRAKFGNDFLRMMAGYGSGNVNLVGQDETFVDALGKDEAAMEAINQVADYVKENPEEAAILAAGSMMLSPAGGVASVTARALANRLGAAFKPLLKLFTRKSPTKSQKQPPEFIGPAQAKRYFSPTQAMTKGVPAAGVAGVAAKELGPPILEGIQSLGTKMGAPFFPKEPKLDQTAAGQANTATAGLPAVAPASVLDAERMKRINEIPTPPLPRSVPKDPTELLPQINTEETKDTDQKPIPKVTGDESSSELSTKDGIISDRLSKLADTLAIYAASDPRVPGGFARAAFKQNMILLDEARKADALRLRREGLAVQSRLADLKEKGLNLTFYSNRLKEIDDGITEANELLYQPGAVGYNLQVAEQALQKALEEESTFLGRATSGIIGVSKAELEEQIKEKKNAVTLAEGLLERSQDRLYGDLKVERDEIKKFLNEYGLNYRGDETKEDFDLNKDPTKQ